MYYVVLTPSFDKLPTIAHFSITAVVSGNIACSHAPSILSSSAKPYHKNNTHHQIPQIFYFFL